MSDDELRLLSYEDLLHETDLAFCLLIEGDQYWIPKQLIVDHDEVTREMFVPVWLLEKRGLL